MDRGLKALKAQARREWDDVPSGKPGGESDGFSPELEPLDDFEEEDTGIYSPVLEPLSKYHPEDLLDPDEDLRVLRQVRNTIIEAFGGAVSTTTSQSIDRSRDDELLAAERAKGMGSGEVAFNAAGKGDDSEFHGEVMLDKKRYEWEDKYKPRKPRFFNRVKTGFEWNKYNQTHYDHDNPPPKIVQGYKFNIFYPDLIDKAKAPTYHVEKSDTADTVMLRFSAGPPYEDVAFKIVNREWNLSHKFGFRVVFDRGVLQLYFNVKRWRYHPRLARMARNLPRRTDVSISFLPPPPQWRLFQPDSEVLVTPPRPPKNEVFVFGEPQRFGPKPMPLDADEWLCNLVRVMPVMHSEVSEVSLVFSGQGLSNLHLSFCMPSKTYGVSRCFHVRDVASKYILVFQKSFHVFSHKDVASKRSLQWEIQWEMAEVHKSGGNPEAPELTNELEKLQEMLQSASLELLVPWVGDDGG
ncbi:unnamed protein product [Cladocopium goreaui]|uniref:Alpha,alpha-trehalose-phosphate synthase [UDP-forming] 1 n=1 Tax=Cladocopium goreaui TaxID=2562237 RepID=A0A9P1FU40_9DINO|nr:unnamed protein product [Cladocopium goreaui]